MSGSTSTLLPQECKQKVSDLRSALLSAAQRVRAVEQQALNAENNVWHENKKLFGKCFPTAITENWTAGSVRNASRSSVERLVLEPLWREMRKRVGYHPYGKVLEENEDRDLERKPLLELLFLQLALLEKEYEVAQLNDSKLNKRILRQEKEERQKGKVSMTIADSGAVQRLKAERPQIWARVVEESGFLHQYVTRLRAFQEQILTYEIPGSFDGGVTTARTGSKGNNEMATEFAEQRLAAIPAIVARAVCDWYFYEAVGELDRLKNWYRVYKTDFLYNEKLPEEIRKRLEGSLKNGTANGGVVANGESSAVEQDPNDPVAAISIFVKNFDKTLEQLDMRKHGFLKHMDFGFQEIVPARGLEQKPWRISITLPVVANVLSELKRAVSRSQASSVPELERAARDLINDYRKGTDVGAFVACCTDGEAAEALLEKILVKPEKRKKQRAAAAKASQPQWLAPDPNRAYVLPTEQDPETMRMNGGDPFAGSSRPASRAVSRATSKQSPAEVLAYGGVVVGMSPSASSSSLLTSDKFNAKIMKRGLPGSGSPSPSGETSTTARTSGGGAAALESTALFVKTPTGSKQTIGATPTQAVDPGTKILELVDRCSAFGFASAGAATGGNANESPSSSGGQLRNKATAPSRSDVLAELVRRVDSIQTHFLDFLNQHAQIADRLVDKDVWNLVVAWLSFRSEGLLELMDFPDDREKVEKWCTSFVGRVGGGAGAGGLDNPLSALEKELRKEIGKMDVKSIDAKAEETAALTELRGLVQFAADPGVRFCVCKDLMRTFGRDLVEKFEAAVRSAKIGVLSEGERLAFLRAAQEAEEDMRMEEVGNHEAGNYNTPASPTKGARGAATLATGRKQLLKCPEFAAQTVPTHEFSTILARNCVGGLLDGSEAPAHLLRSDTPPPESGSRPGSTRGSRVGSKEKNQNVDAASPAASMAETEGGASGGAFAGAPKPAFLAPKKPLNDPPARGRPTLPPILMEELQRPS